MNDKVEKYIKTSRNKLNKMDKLLKGDLAWFKKKNLTIRK